MAASSSSSSSSFVALLLIIIAVAVETRPSAGRDDKQVLHSLFGSHLSALISAPPTSDDITEGSGLSSPAPLAVSHNAATPLAGTQEVKREEKVPRFFLDFLQRRSKMRRRSRTSVVGGRGCFGMKMDRIGSLSGLGC